MDIIEEGMQDAVDLIATCEINNQFSIPEVYENPARWKS